MSRTTYLHDEPNKLLNFYSTVDRKRGTTKLWLVGNTITRVCPYIQEWGLNDIIFMYVVRRDIMLFSNRVNPSLQVLLGVPCTSSWKTHSPLTNLPRLHL